jgi:tetratricopeptide (TPR) repeat protein
MTTANAKLLARVRELWEKKEPDAAMDLLKPEMKEHPDDPNAIAMAGHIYELGGNSPVAYNMFKLATMLAPGEASHWLNFGRSAQDLWRIEEAQKAYTRALSTCNRDETKVYTLGNLAALNIDTGQYEKAMEYVQKALRVDPSKPGVKANLGFTQLATGNWAEGWKNYRFNIGTEERRRQAYSNPPEPLWDGTPGQSIVIYGEQGLGDEIVFASMVEDVARISRKVILDCDPRLEKLFKRSFPQCTVYGTRGHERLAWDKEDRVIDAVIPAAQVGEFVRPTPESCPKEPWLIPDAFRVQMWKDQWKKLGKPVIGIAWTGGIRKTGAKFRFNPLANWESLFELDAHFVSLEYREGEKHPLVHEYKFATRSPDYDDTAALVASLDLVVSVPTSVVHVAGAVGTPVVAMHGPMDCWKYHSNIPFHDAHHIQWQGNWKTTVDAAAIKVKECLRSSSELTLVNPSRSTSSPTPSSDTQASQSPLRRSA